MSSVAFDAGALIALERNNRRLLALLARAKESDTLNVIGQHRGHDLQVENGSSRHGTAMKQVNPSLNSTGGDRQNVKKLE